MFDTCLGKIRLYILQDTRVEDSWMSRTYLYDPVRADREAKNAYVPNIGDVVVLENGLWDLWVILYPNAPIVPEDGILAMQHGGFKNVTYGAGCGTWVVQRQRDDTRNPVWTDPELNRHGEGEHEQRHVVVTRDIDGMYRYWPYLNNQDEIKAILRASRLKILDDVYRTSNRVTSESAKDAPPNSIGNIARISDYLYFSAQGCVLRQNMYADCVAPNGLPPAYTRDYATYGMACKTPRVAPLLVVEEPELPTPVASPQPVITPAHMPVCVEKPALVVKTVLRPTVSVQKSTVVAKTPAGVVKQRATAVVKPKRARAVAVTVEKVPANMHGVRRIMLGVRSG